MSQEKQKTSVSLDAGTLRKLKKEAIRRRRSVSSLVEIWLERALNPTGEQPREIKL